jgi:phosphoserine phosphatase
MTHDLVVHGGAVPTWLLERLVALTGATRVEARPPQAVRLKGAHPHPAIRELCENERLDFAFLPAGRRLADYRLLAMDMDSTLITIECIDEVADFAGRKDEVSAITEAAMRGEIDYTESLQRRVAILAGLGSEALDRVYDERLRLSPGADALIAAAKNAGMTTMIVSGGFTYFTHRLRDQLGLDHAFSNELEIVDGKLTGRVLGDIVDAQGKQAHVKAIRKSLGLTKEQVITIGDGANDLLMMAESDLSVAYHAKPLAREEAAVALNFTGLDGLLSVLED